MLGQRPTSMIEKMGVPAKYIAMAAPDLIDFDPISDRTILSFVSPIATTPSRIRFTIISDVMLMILFPCFARETGEFGFIPLYEHIRVTIDVQIFTGHKLPLKNKKKSNQNLLYQEMSTRSGSNLVLRVLINF